MIFNDFVAIGSPGKFHVVAFYAVGEAILQPIAISFMYPYECVGSSGEISAV
jgi:hypothetical protein